MNLLVGLAILFLLAGITPALTRRSDRSHRLIALVPLALLLWIWPKGTSSTPLAGPFSAISLAWVPQLSVNIDLSLDGLGLLFSLLILGIGALILLYTGSYLKNSPKRPKILGFLVFFMASMWGLVLSDNMYLMFLFWELTSVSSYLLIGYNHESAASRKKALQAFLVTGMGGLALLAGLVLLHFSTGTAQWSAFTSAKPLDSNPLTAVALGLLLLGAFTKSAQFPFHFWLPNAMAAPTPISAYLHSATMVKAGIYLLLRINSSVDHLPFWQETLSGIGALTMIWGAWLGLWQTDLKRILAYTTLSVLGILVMLIGLNHDQAVKAALLFLLGHAFYKAALFMTTGMIDLSTGSRDVRVLRGLRKAMPWTAAAAVLAALSKAGFPPFFGFLGKEYFYKAGLASEGPQGLLLTLAVVTNMLLMALALKTGFHPFFGKAAPSAPTPRTLSDPEWELWLPPLLLALAGLGLGLFPSFLEYPLLSHASSVVTLSPTNVSVALWHGFALPLLLSMVTLAGGGGLYLLHRKLWERADWVLQSIPWTVESLYVALMNGMEHTAQWITRRLQNGKLPQYLITMLLGTTVFFVLGVPAPALTWPALDTVSIFGLTLATLMISAALFASITQSRLAALLSLSVVGMGMAMIFLLFSAPDLAITQLVVETLIVVLFMFVVFRLPRLRQLSSLRRRLFDGAFALTIGLAVFFLMLTSLQVQLAAPIGTELGHWSYTLAKGKNVVNVILVDFRALDTLGELLVLGIAALGVLALIRNPNPKRDDRDHPSSSGNSAP
jgi:multicomponent Na+:H+ antiporter subunit A